MRPKLSLGVFGLIPSVAIFENTPAPQAPVLDPIPLSAVGVRFGVAGARLTGALLILIPRGCGASTHSFLLSRSVIFVLALFDLLSPCPFSSEEMKTI
jgi:hypothetical protein